MHRIHRRQAVACVCFLVCVGAIATLAYAQTGTSGVIRLVPIEKPSWAVYPFSANYPTDKYTLDPSNRELTFESSAGNTPVWFRLEGSGWDATKGLRGFDIYLKMADAWCPTQPCNCVTSTMIEAHPTGCGVGAECPNGGECILGKCAGAFVNKTDTTYVFFGKEHEANTHSKYPRFVYNVRLPSSQSAVTNNSTKTLGYLMLYTRDACPQETHVKLNFDSEIASEFILGDGSRSQPTTELGVVICKGTAGAVP